MAVVSANRLELLQIADAVAREKVIDRQIVIEAGRVVAAGGVEVDLAGVVLDLVDDEEVARQPQRPAPDRRRGRPREGDRPPDRHRGDGGGDRQGRPLALRRRDSAETVCL
jgi:hypothetical protein